MHVRPGQYTSVMQRYLTNQVARQDSRHGGPEESRDAKHAHCLTASTAKVDWSCYENA